MNVIFLLFSTIIIASAGGTSFVPEDKFHKGDQHFKEVYECFMEKNRCPNEKFTEIKRKYLKK